MARAMFNGEVIAESDDIVEVEGNLYFPADSLNTGFVQESDLKTACPWKGEASYLDVVVGDKRVENGAWYYPETKEAANNIKGRYAFWNGVQVEA
ncbi:MAG: DUF427 domain-containing protein [Planctomycetota bacterium]